jgi:hypothetical protein
MTPARSWKARAVQLRAHQNNRSSTAARSLAPARALSSMEYRYLTLEPCRRGPTIPCQIREVNFPADLDSRARPLGLRRAEDHMTKLEEKLLEIEVPEAAFQLREGSRSASTSQVPIRPRSGSSRQTGKSQGSGSF